jgi:hypothetical protein
VKKPEYEPLCSCVDPKTGLRKRATMYVHIDGVTRLVCSSHPVPRDCLSPGQRSKAANRARSDWDASNTHFTPTPRSDEL